MKCNQQNLLVSVADLVVVLEVVDVNRSEMKMRLCKSFNLLFNIYEKLPFSDPSVGHSSSQNPHWLRTGTPVKEFVWVGHHGRVLLRVEMQFVISFPLKMKGKIQGDPSTVLHWFFCTQSSYSSYDKL